MKVALVSMKHIPGDVDANVERQLIWLDRARAANARFVGFPEGSLTGWGKDCTRPLTLNSAALRIIAAYARRHRIFIGTCFVEKNGSRLFNSAAVFGPRGRIGVMRKVNLVEREARPYTPGREFPVFKVAGCRMGVAICSDATRFEMLHLLALRGAEVIFAPHANILADRGGTADSWVRWRMERWPLFAKDTRVAILGVNCAGLFAGRMPGDQRSEYCGGAMIVDANGMIAGPLRGNHQREGMLVSKIDLSAIRRQRKKDFLAHSFQAAIVYNRRSGWAFGLR